MADIINNDNLNPAVLKTVIEGVEPQKERRLAKVFPEQQVFDRNAVYNVVNNTSVKAGSIIGFDAETPIKNKPQMQKKWAELTKITNAYFYTEEELLHYNKPRSEQEAEQVIEDVMKSVVDLSEGIQDTKELIRANFVYRGVFDYEDPKSQVKIGFELDLPEGTFQSAGDLEDENVNPLEELIKQVESYQENNGFAEPDYMVMNRRTYAKLKRNPNVVEQVYGTNANGKMLRDSDIQEMFTELGLPTLEIDNDYTVIEGVLEDKRVQHMPDNRVVMHAAQLGQTLIGPAVEADYQPTMYVQNLQTADAPNAKTIVGQVTIPVLQNEYGISILDFGENSEEETEETP